MGEQESKGLQSFKQQLVLELEKRVKDKILENENKELLAKLISNADSITEAQAIMALGTTYKRTGFHFDKRLEKSSDKIFYLKKNEELSFSCDFEDFTKGNKQNKDEAEAVEMKNCGFQARNKGVTKAVMTEVEGKESTIYRSNATPLKHTLIIGDNYPALQSLLITYKEKVKVIYIDPPYGKDDLGEFAKTNYHNAITRDNLLSMLYPRLQLAKELLKDDGVIFCSIDNKNQAYVKCLFDEVFGEENFVEIFLWNKTQTPPSASNKTRKTHEFILCYQKKKDNQKMIARLSEGGDAPLWNETNSERVLTFPANYVYSNLENGIYKKGIREKIELLDNVKVENGKIINSFRLKGHFRWKQETLDLEILQNVFLIVKSNKFSIRYCRQEERIVMPTNEISKKDGVGTNETASSELGEIMGDKIFNFNKPITLCKYLISLVSNTQSQTQTTKEQFTPPPPRSLAA